MKRLTSLLLSLMLCAAIVALSGGVAFMGCCHEAEQTAQTEACCCEDEDGGTCRCDEKEAGGMGDAPCMAITIHKLAPTDVAPTFHFSFTDHPLPLAPFLLAAWDVFHPAPTAKAQTAGGEADTGPPRAYLRRLRVLRI